MSELLRVENLHVAVGGKTLLHGINLTVNTGEVHVIMGVNGAGKSTLLHAIMGNPAYEITEGHVYFEGEDITELSTDKRARLGIFYLSRILFLLRGLRQKILSVRRRRQFQGSSSACFLSSAF